MRQLMFRPDHGLEWIDVPPPVLDDPTDAIVRPVAVAVCDADRAIVAGKIPTTVPHRFGHEFVADVIDIGPAVSSVRIGDRVVVPFKISCGRCDPCRRGATAACDTVPLRSAYGFPTAMSGEWGGAVSDAVRVPFADHMLVALPNDVPVQQAASAGDNLADAYRCVGPGLARRPGSATLIVAAGGGAPSIALYAAAIAVALGAEHVDYVDRDAERLDLARRLGANPIAAQHPSDLAQLADYPITVDASAHPSGRWLDATIRATEPYGTCTSCGAYQHDTVIPLGHMYERGIEFTVGWVNARPIIPRVLALLADRQLDIGHIHTTVDWDTAVETIPAGHTKLVLVRPD